MLRLQAGHNSLRDADGRRTLQRFEYSVDHEKAFDVSAAAAGNARIRHLDGSREGGPSRAREAAGDAYGVSRGFSRAARTGGAPSPSAGEAESKETQHWQIHRRYAPS